jgi:hypothetical protein
MGKRVSEIALTIQGVVEAAYDMRRPEEPAAAATVENLKRLRSGTKKVTQKAGSALSQNKKTKSKWDVRGVITLAQCRTTRLGSLAPPAVGRRDVT